MSRIQNYIATTFTANAGNVKAVMGEISGSMQNVGRSAMEAGRNSSVMSNQMRALATTMRYALAGSMVFGVTSLVRSMSQLQTQMALMSTLSDSLSESTRNMFNTSSGLRDRLDELQQASLTALTPVNQLADATVNLLSSVQGVDAGQVTKITTALAEGAQLAQVPVEDLTKGITGMIQAFGERPTQANFSGLTRGFITLTHRAPGGIAAGPQVIQQLGPAALAANIAHVSPQQLLGLTTTVLRAGGSPATAMRGLNFLLQSIATPNKQEAKVLAGIGITPDFVQRQGGVAAILKLVQAMKNKGVSGNIARNAPIFLADETQLSDVEGMGVQGMAGLGVGGQGLQLGQRAVGRVHAVRALVALLRGLNSGTFQSDITAVNNSILGIGKEGRSLEDQFADFRKQQPLKAASIALQGLALEIPRSLEKVMNPIARVVDRGAGFAIHHQRATRNVMFGTSAFLAAMGIANIVSRVTGGRGGLIGRFGRLLPGGGGRGFVTERAIADATNPARAGVLGGSPQEPMYVTIVGPPLLGPGFGGGGGGPSGLGGKAEDQITKNAPWLYAFRDRLFGRGIPKVGLKGLSTAALLFGAELPAAGDILSMARGKDPFKATDKGKMGAYPPIVQRYFKLDERNELVPRKGTPQNIIDALNASRSGGKILGIFPGGHRDVDPNKAARLIKGAQLTELNAILAQFHRRDPIYGVTRINSQHKEIIRGKAEVVLDVNLTTEKGKSRTTIHVPFDMYANGRNPSSRGQTGKTKGNAP